MNRRGFLAALGAILAVPSIARAQEPSIDPDAVRALSERIANHVYGRRDPGFVDPRTGLPLADHPDFDGRSDIKIAPDFQWRPGDAIVSRSRAQFAVWRGVTEQ